MDEQLADYFVSLAAGLTQKVLEVGGRGVRKKYSDSPKGRALERCYKAGLVAIARASRNPAGVLEYLEQVYKPYFNNADVAKELGKLLEEQLPSIETLKEIFEDDFGYKRFVAGATFEESMAAFFSGFEQEAASEVELQGALFFRSLQQILTELKHTNQLNPDVGTLERRYLERLMMRCDKLDLTLETGKKDSPDNQVKLEAVFTALELEGLKKSEKVTVEDTIKRRKQEQVERMATEDEAVAIAAVEAVAAVPRLVILGRPGGGKSTLVNHICARLAAHRLSLDDKPLLGWDNQPALLPVRIILRRFAAWDPPSGVAPGTAGHVWAYIKHQLNTWGIEEACKFVEETLKESGGAVFFDGLDEVSISDEVEKRSQLKRAIEEFAEGLKNCKIVVTCREYAYKDGDRWRLQASVFPVVMLSLFNLDQIKTFIQAWYAAVAPQKEWDEVTTDGKSRVLYQAVEQLAFLRELAQYPLLLTLMAQVHGGEGYLPEDRADLYDKAVNLLLAVWDNRIYIDTEASSGAEESKVLRIGVQTAVLRSVLAEVAYEAHKRQEANPDRGERSADIPAEQLRETLVKVVESETLVKEILEYIQHRAGVLVANDNYTYSFLHRTFQEYLAATHILQKSTHAEILEQHLSSDIDWWREVFLLAAGDARYPVIVANLVDQLVPLAKGRVALTEPLSRRINLAAQALWETGFVEAARKEEEAKEGRYSQTYRRILNWLEYAFQAAELDAGHRMACGEALSRLGDPRPAVLTCEEIAFCEVPAGQFWMGSGKNDKRSGDNEKPQHQVDLNYPYWIGMYPVTVAQFREFVDETGKAPHDPDSLRGVNNAPVVWISWFESRAYCNWLTIKLQKLAGQKAHHDKHAEMWQGLASGRLIVALASEAEWEKAARGMSDKRIYPWEGDWDIERCNNGYLGFGKPSSVGCFPEGISTFAVHDMVGNVWEWTRDWWNRGRYKDISEEVTVNPESPNKGESRVVRGGSFLYDNYYCRCSARDNHDPDGRNGYVGFRIVVLPSTMIDVTDER